MRAVEDINVLENHQIFSDNLQLFNQVLTDIENAQKSICIETYKFADDAIGIRFRNALTKKSRQGVKIKLLIDSWGAYINEEFFSELITNGGQLRFFKKLKYSFDAFTKHHRRNHRKLFIIDDKITYLCSANITTYSLSWRELSVRMEGLITNPFKRTFNDSWKIFEKSIFKQKMQLRQISIGNFRIIRDIPSITKQRVKKKFEDLIKNAKKEIIIETPYFLPGFILRRQIMDAAKRGVEIKIITPQNSDVAFVDTLRSKYMGMLYRSGVNFHFYKPSNLHSKLMLVDGEAFFFGTSNFDYRSFRYMFEIMLYGIEPLLYLDLTKHVRATLDDCMPFDYERWQRRPFIHKVFEQLLVPFRHYL